MIRRKVLVILIILPVIVYCVISFLNSQIIDRKYAIKYGEILNSYNISVVDEFLGGTTRITCGDQTKTYQELRHNVISAFEEKKFTISSYGHGDGLFIGKTQNVGIQSYVEIENIGSIEIYVDMVIKRSFLNGYSVESLSSDDEFFGYLFFGLPIEVQ